MSYYRNTGNVIIVIPNNYYNKRHLFPYSDDGVKKQVKRGRERWIMNKERGEGEGRQVKFAFSRRNYHLIHLYVDIIMFHCEQ